MVEVDSLQRESGALHHRAAAFRTVSALGGGAGDVTDVDVVAAFGVVLFIVTLATAMLTLGQAPPYAPGERMAFGISYLGMRLGTAAVSVDPSEGALVPVELEAHTTGVASSVYAFRERLRTTVDPDTGLPAVEGVEEEVY